MAETTFVLNFTAGTLTYRFGFRPETTLPLPDGLLTENTSLEALTVFPERSEAVAQLPGGRHAVVELRGDASADKLLAGRKVVYLDQNKWSLLDRVRQGSTLPAKQNAAAERLLSMVDQRELVLPASAAHYVETTPLHGEKRVALGATIASLSRGWQMRNPLHVRFEELARDARGEQPAAVEVFAPQVRDVFGSPLSRLDRDPRLPAPFDTLGRDLSPALAVMELLIDPLQVPDEGGAAKAEAWAADLARFGHYMSEERFGPERARQAVLGKLLADLAEEVIGVSEMAGIDPEEIVNRYLGPEDPIGRMPSVSRVRGVLYGRLRNSTQRWEGNDLLDIANLACAAGYADLVVGERQTISYLRQATNVPAGAQLATNLVDAVDLLLAA
jgi:hypothetical protein